jgi:CHAT domain-containing protein
MLKILTCIRKFLAGLILFSGLTAHCSGSNLVFVSQIATERYGVAFNNKANNNSLQELPSMNLRLLGLINSYKPESGDKETEERIHLLIDTIAQNIGSHITDSLTSSDSFYLIGIYFLLSGNYHNAADNLESSLAVRGKKDNRYGRALSNLGIAYKGFGDYYKMAEFELTALELYKKLYGASSPELIYPYLNLVEAYIELQQYEMAIEYSSKAITIATNNPDKVKTEDLVNLYADMGACFNRLTDFSKAISYYKMSESIHKTNKLPFDKNYLNIMNSLAIAYGAIGLNEKASEYYERGVALAISLPVNSSFSFNIVNSYAIFLGNSGKTKEGAALLERALAKAYSDKEKSQQLYFEALSNYADFLQNYSIDNSKSLKCFAECRNYVLKNPKDILLKNRVIVGYSLSLARSGEPEKAMELIQDMLAYEYKLIGTAGIYNNPDIESISADKTSLKIFKAKHLILWALFEKSRDLKILETASKTSEIIVSLLDKMRINISEEESRLVLGDKYRDSYYNAIRDFSMLYNLTTDKMFLEKAFMYSEKSKVASLLTSTRELKAVQFQIPPDVAEFELKLKRDISTLNMFITDEGNKENSDNVLINSWNEKLVKNLSIKDSLVNVLEKKYPGYYQIKYNTRVASLNDIPRIVGRNGNYINYLLSDTILYIFVANRKHKQILSVTVDTGFYNNIRQFRNLLSMPDLSGDALNQYNSYQTSGVELSKKLVDPVRPYLISNKLFISPDNILSYIPFETIPTARSSESRPFFRSIPYMINDFEISYTYSATFMAESLSERSTFRNKVIAFAPNYPKSIDIQSVILKRQTQGGLLRDLPYARQEAEYVTDITGGSLYENSEAKSSVYKNEAGKYNIIHLAMHTLVNDKDPMNSTLIFSPESDTLEERYLKTYEVYGIPLKAKMVVLSSCNTGSGLLFSGEGILSLARGFIYSGSKSVVMSMWEIEDRSGTEVVKRFYDHLKRGYSKSGALRSAKLSFTKSADNLRSHPYFWSALIVYGNNSPLYYNRYAVIASVLLSLIIICLIIYLLKRRYS